MLCNRYCLNLPTQASLSSDLTALLSCQQTEEVSTIKENTSFPDTKSP